MKKGVGELVAQVLLDAVAPVGVNQQVLAAADAAAGPTKKARRFGKSGCFHLHEALVAVAVLEEENLHERTGRRQLQVFVNLLAEVGQLAKNRQVLLHFEIRQENELGNAIAEFPWCAGHILALAWIWDRRCQRNQMAACGIGPEQTGRHPYQAPGNRVFHEDLAER